jgi:hypothetical protein
MSSSTKREVSHDPREIEPKHRRSSRLNRKHPGSHSRKSNTPTEAKIPKIVKSSSSTEKAKLEPSLQVLPTVCHLNGYIPRGVDQVGDVLP